VKDLSIVNIDGPQGIGKTSQVSLLKKYIESKGLKCKVLKLKDTIPSAIDCINETYDFLEEFDGVVITEGSIAEMIQIDINAGMPTLDVREKYRQVIFQYEKLYHQYGMANILLTIDNIDVCKCRLEKRARLFQQDVEIINEKLERELINGLKSFDNHVITTNLKFHVLNTEEDQKMLEVHGDIIKLIEKNFKIKKPSFEG
jgi:hypothetical protein